MDKKKENYLINKVNNLTLNVNNIRLHLLDLQKRQDKMLSLLGDINTELLERWEEELEEEDDD